jgi:XTP/dITP diphosphohydrolase
MDKPQIVIMATNNAHKLEEVRQILGNAFTVKGLNDIGCMEDIPETADTLEGNALQKALYVHEHYGVNCFADDTGLEVDALGGAPGVYTARFGALNGYGKSHDANANIQCLLDKLKEAETRTARFRTVIALVQNDKEMLFEGIVEGEILLQPVGEGGFGYDPVFAPIEANGLAFAQMSAEAKNAISHRGRAIKKLAEYLCHKQ